jgi:hypothetical protein
MPTRCLDSCRNQGTGQAPRTLASSHDARCARGAVGVAAPRDGAKCGATAFHHTRPRVRVSALGSAEVLPLAHRRCRSCSRARAAWGLACCSASSYRGALMRSLRTGPLTQAGRDSVARERVGAAHASCAACFMARAPGAARPFAGSGARGARGSARGPSSLPEIGERRSRPEALVPPRRSCRPRSSGHRRPRDAPGCPLPRHPPTTRRHPTSLNRASAFSGDGIMGSARPWPDRGLIARL